MAIDRPQGSTSEAGLLALEGRIALGGLLTSAGADTFMGVVQSFGRVVVENGNDQAQIYA